MTRSNAAAQPREPLYFDARLRPHRSLSRRGFLILMLAICAVSFAAGLALFLAGAWPIVGFFGLDVALIYGAFRLNYRRARTYETLRLSRDDLLVEHVDHRGRRRNWRFQPYWLQVLMEDPDTGDGRLVLRSHGQSLEIAGFLPPAERLDLARALRQALARLRDARPPCAPSRA